MNLHLQMNSDEKTAKNAWELYDINYNLLNVVQFYVQEMPWSVWVIFKFRKLNVNNLVLQYSEKLT